MPARRTRRGSTRRIEDLDARGIEALRLALKEVDTFNDGCLPTDGSLCVALQVCGDACRACYARDKVPEIVL